jgi:hypothetical protein
MNYCPNQDIYKRYIYKQPFRGGRIGRAGGLAGIDSA